MRWFGFALFGLLATTIAAADPLGASPAQSASSWWMWALVVLGIGGLIAAAWLLIQREIRKREAQRNEPIRLAEGEVDDVLQNIVCSLSHNQSKVVAELNRSSGVNQG